MTRDGIIRNDNSFCHVPSLMLSSDSNKRFFVPEVTVSEVDEDCVFPPPTWLRKDPLHVPISASLDLQDQTKPFLNQRARDHLTINAISHHIAACHSLLELSSTMSASANLKDPSQATIDDLAAPPAPAPVTEPVDEPSEGVVFSDQPTRAQKRKAEGTHSSRFAALQKFWSSSPLTLCSHAACPRVPFSGRSRRCSFCGWFWGCSLYSCAMGGTGIYRQRAKEHDLQHVHHARGS